ncbi:MAG: hypothetical protein V4726_08450 [Verrucomicrobiota bacterium]
MIPPLFLRPLLLRPLLLRPLPSGPVASPLAFLLAAAFLPFAAGVSRAAEWDQVVAGYGNLEWIAGLGGESPNNGNEWNFADGRDAREAELSEPHSAMGDLNGNVLVADKNAHAIRLIRPDGTLHTIAGTNVAGHNGDGPATQRQLNGPQNAYPLPDGSFYIMDTGNRMIRKVDPAGMMTTLITEQNAWLSRGLWVKRDGSLIYYCTTTSLHRWTPAMGNNPGTVMASVFQECGNIDVAANGDVYVTDRTLSQVFRVAPDATPATFTPVVVAGTGGNDDDGPGSNGTAALELGLRGVRGIAFHPLGGYFLATHKGGDIWYVDTAGKAWVTVNGNDGSVHNPSPQPLPAAGMTIAEPRCVSVAINGDLLMATNDAGYIRRARFTGPVSPAPALQAGMTGSGGFRLEWAGADDKWYRVDSASDPSGSWVPRSVLAPPYSGPNSWTDPESAEFSRQFYRVREFRNWPN